MPSTFRLELAGVFLAASYMLGHMFFRQDPKFLDRKSCARIAPEKYDGPADQNHVEFPYRKLRGYLRQRGFDHLADMIPWGDSKDDEFKKRSKHFINLLKIRIEFLFPSRYGRIARNEAHIRLMSSGWYAAGGLRFLSIFGLIMAAGAMIITGVRHGHFPSFDGVSHSGSLLMAGSTLLGSLLVRSQIERFLHYQRVREVVFLLETAYFTHLLEPGLFEPVLTDDGTGLKAT